MAFSWPGRILRASTNAAAVVSAIDTITQGWPVTPITPAVANPKTGTEMPIRA